MRLNKQIKSEIKNKIVKDVYDPKYKALKEKEQGLADRMYELACTGKHTFLEKAPEGMFLVSQTICIVKDDISPMYVDMSKERRIPYKLSRNCAWPGDGSPVFDSIIKSLVDKRKETHALERQRRDFEREVEAALDKVTTLQALQKAWPDVDRYIPAEVKAGKNLPAINFNSIAQKVAESRKDNV